MYNAIKYELKDGIAYVTVNRPQALNALNGDVLDELYNCFSAINEDPAVKVAIVTGEGRAFVAGADISVMQEFDAVQGIDWGFKGHRTMNTIEACRVPVIAAINGFALGGGCELSMACDFRIASNKAKFGQPEVNLGIIPGFGGTQRLAKLVGMGMAKYLVYTADMIDAEEAYRIGLVQKVVEPEELMTVCEDIAKKIISKGQIAVETAKRVMNAGIGAEVTQATPLEKEAFALLFGTEDQSEGMKAFLEKRPANFQGK